MFQQLSFLAILIFCFQNLAAQNKFDAKLIQKVNAYSQQSQKKDVAIKVLVKLQSPADVDLLRTEWCKVNTVLGDIATVEISLSQIHQLQSIVAIKRVSLGVLHQPSMDSVKYHTNALAVQKGWGPIDGAYKGKGTIIGIVDTGIDYYHDEFRDAGKKDETRILYLWNQWDEDGQNPDSFSYGSEYSKTQIDDEINGRANIIPRSDYDPTGRGGDGHGTHVAGIAAGLSGMAPEADMVIVSTDWESASIIDGVKYILEKAIALNRPCVVNLSLGSQYDLHNGTGLKAEAYKRLAELRPTGTAIICAAGNDGYSNLVWGGFEVEDNYTYYYGSPVELAFAIPDSAMKTMSISVTSYLVDYDWEQNYFTVKKELGRFESIVPGNLENTDSVYSELKYSDGALAGALTAKLDNDPVESDENMVVLSINDYANINVNTNPPVYEKMEVYKVRVYGQGKFYSWLQAVPTSLTGSIARSIPDPEKVGLDTTANWIGPRSDYSIIAPALYKHTIAVGASVNRLNYYDTKGTLKPSPWNRYPAGSLANFSSKGPSIDNRILPEIVAPGMHVFSSIPSWYKGWSDKVLDGTYAASSGTSMASPVMAGAVALYFQQNPKATLDSLRKDFLENTVTDDFTASNGVLPNNHWGWGKLDIFKVMSNGIFFGIETPENKISIYPNPANDFINTDKKWESLEIWTTSGQLVKAANQYQAHLSIADLSAGTYLIEVTVDGEVIRRLVVVR